MPKQPFTLINDGRTVSVSANVDGDRIAISPAVLHDTLGWELTPQGLCKGDRCVVTTSQPDLVSDDGVDLAAFAQLMDRPLATDIQERIACIGASVAQRAVPLEARIAPDFMLPDLTGQRHALSDYRGKKVLLVVYASW